MSDRRCDLFVDSAQSTKTAARMVDDRFEPGTLVQPMPVGPIMTLVRYGYRDGERMAQCQWFERPGELGEGFFSDAELTAYEPRRSAGAPGVTLIAASILFRVACVLAATWLVTKAFRRNAAGRTLTKTMDA